MADDKAKAIIARQQQLKSDRGTFEQHWQELAEVVRPMRADFTVQQAPGAKRTSKIFDGTAGLAAENLASGLWGMITNSANQWFTLRSPHDDLNRRSDVRLWLDSSAQAMRDALAANGGQFYSRVIELYRDLVSFGTGVFYTDEMIGRGQLFFSCRHLAECYIAENEFEQVDTIYRRFRWTARQAVRKWGGDPARIGKCLAEAYAKNPDERREFIHAVYPQADTGRGRWRWSSCYVAVDDAVLLEERGYHEFPFMVPRWSTSTGEVYGDSPGMLALPDTKMLQAMSKATIVGAQKAVAPPLLAPDENTIGDIRTSPDSIIYGAVDQQGRQLIHPFRSGADVGLGLEMENQRRNAIKEAFYWSLLMLAAMSGDRTATEILQRQEEKLRLMGPQLGRIQSEFLSPLINRVFAIMARADAFGPPPPALQAYPDVTVAYVSPLDRAQRAVEGAAVTRWLEGLAPIAAVKPGVMDNVDGDETARVLADAYGVPGRLIVDPRQVKMMRDQQAKLQAAQMLTNGAPQVATALKQTAEAAATARGARSAA